MFRGFIEDKMDEKKRLKSSESLSKWLQSNFKDKNRTLFIKSHKKQKIVGAMITNVLMDHSTDK